jgi:hypothetical protein
MAFEPFRRYLTSDHRSPVTGQPFGRAAASDYPSRLRRLETVLQIPVENAPPIFLRALAQDLRHDSRVIPVVSQSARGDIAVALRAYANFLEGMNNILPSDHVDTYFSPGSDHIIAVLRAAGFATVPTRAGNISELNRDRLTLYVRLDPPQTIIIHPVFQEYYSALYRLTGTVRQRRLTFYHNSKLSKFPKRDNGSGLIHYGIPFLIGSDMGIRNFVDELQSLLTAVSPLTPEAEIGDELETVETEATVLRQARIGQGRFRSDLLNFWQGQCILTDVAVPELLRASHIKSWSESNHKERLDPFNGLLLSVHLDALFDRAIITFSDSGEMLVSTRLSDRDRQVFGLATPGRRLLLNVRHIEYMRHHQDRFTRNEIIF